MMPTLPERVARIESQLEENNRTTWRIHEAVYGNGTPGIRAQIHAMHRIIAVLCWLTGVMIAAAGVAISVFIAVYK